MDNTAGVPELLAELDRARAVSDRAIPVAPPRRVLGVQLGDDLYGLDIADVREIAKLTPLTWVPGAPPVIAGVTNLRGQMLPVVDLRVVLGEEPRRNPAGANAPVIPPRSRIVVVSQHHAQGEISMGLLVDGVTEVHDLRGPVDPPLVVRSGLAPLTEGQTQLGDRTLILLSLSNVINRLIG